MIPMFHSSGDPGSPNDPCGNRRAVGLRGPLVAVAVLAMALVDFIEQRREMLRSRR